MSSAVTAWSKTSAGYISSNGSVIPNAVAKGIDVSSHQGSIDWESVAADGIDFAIIRSSYGWLDDMTDTSQQDRYLKQNAAACESLGIPYGIYHYSYANLSISSEAGTCEAEYVLNAISGLHPTLPIYYDLEDASLPKNTSSLATIATQFCEKIADEGYVPGVYANLNWWTNYLTDSSFDSWSRWVAQYNSECTYTGDYRYWQCTSEGSVDGISGNVDLDFRLRESSVEVYRLYNPYSGEHLYTLSSSERDHLSSIGWNYEGIGWYAPTSGDSVYRLYNPYSGDHLYTTSSSEYASLQTIDWKGEGTAWHTAPAASGEPLFRQFNPYETIGTHNYTLSVAERDNLVSLGWQDEGIAWYGA